MAESPWQLSPAQWQELSPYLEDALAAGDEERQAWLAAFRVQHPDVADMIEELLEEHQALSAEGFLEAEPLRPAHESSWAGHSVGPWRLISPIGHGGMGTVWLAERSDGRFERMVAVKFLQWTIASPAAIERFEREGKILGQLQHPHIAELIDAGVSGRDEPYLVLEYVAGEQVDRYCDQHKLGTAARIRVFLDVLDAVAHAHANLIVHRDIKPSNVMVSSEGSVKLLDFGIARLLSDGADSTATLTQQAGVAMTPLFAAPEQLTNGPVTTATDVYALGSLLFLLLTGQHPAGPGPFSAAELIRTITEKLPPRPSDVVARLPSADVSEQTGLVPERLRRQLRGDLDTIVLKALRKSPEERYGSVAALAEDLRRYLAHQPVGARPDTLTYRTRKFVRRNRTAVALTATAMAAVAGGVVGIMMQAHTARDERDLAYRQVSRANAISDLEDFLLADAAPGGQPFSVDELLGRAEHIVTREHVANNTDRASLLISIGQQYATEDEDTKSGRVLEEAYALSLGIADPAVRARASCALASEVAQNGDPSRGESLIQSGLAETPGEPQYALDRVFCLDRGREVADHNGASQLALDRALQAQRTLTASPFNSEVMQWHTEIEIGEAYREAGRYRQATQSFQRSYDLMKDLGRDDTETAGTLLNNWALALDAMGNPLEAEKIFAHAIQLSRDNRGDQAVSPVLLINYARVLRELARTSDSVDYAERGYHAAIELGDQVAADQAMLELARIYRQAGQLARSNGMLDEVDAKLRKNLPPGHWAFASLASERELNAQAAGDLMGAARFAEKAMNIVEAAISRTQEGQQLLPILLGRQSRLELQTGQTEQALADASGELALLQKELEPGEYSHNVGHAYMDFGRALQAHGEIEQARAAYRHAAQHLEVTLGSDHPEVLAARRLLATLASK